VVIIPQWEDPATLNKKREIKAGREVKNRQVSPAWDKGSFQEKVLSSCFFLMGAFHKKMNHVLILAGYFRAWCEIIYKESPLDTR